MHFQSTEHVSLLCLRAHRHCVYNCLPLDPYEGIVDGITIKWTPKAKARLPENARKFEKDLDKIKVATEHVAYATARRL